MRQEGTRVFALLLCLTAATMRPAAAQTPPAPSPATAPPARIVWERDFDAALERAKTEKKPLFIAFLMDDEPANDQTIKEHYTDPEIVDLTRRFVCLACCMGEHRIGEDGCTKFPGITCAQHNEIEKKARARWLVGDLVCTPQHVFCDSNGEVVLRRVYLIPKETLAKCLAMTLQATGGDTTGLRPGALVDEEKQKVDGWLADLDSNNLEVRETALRSLGNADDARALPAVLEQCDASHDNATRIAAIGALGRKGHYQAVKPLTALLKDSKAPILMQVAKSLETIQMPEAVPDLFAACKKERRDRVLGALLRAAARSQGSNVEVREFCLRTLKSASSQLKGSVMVALGYLDTHKKIVDVMLPLLENRNQNTRGLATWVLGGQRTPESLKALEELQRNEKTPEVLKLLTSAVKHCRGEIVAGYESSYWAFLSDY
ncbi:MAG TPA: HEAT repeat domain-containing protein [Planctomycetota bacterium]|nr:HEAT repeat domain-containing protein [Planctomycetota bacterium]